MQFESTHTIWKNLTLVPFVVIKNILAVKLKNITDNFTNTRY
jgi:hypothetical protein